MYQQVVIIGRPNVGKSTLFNCLIGKRKAIVNDSPGVTRDWNDQLHKFTDFTVRLIDTPGINNETKNEFEKNLNKKTLKSIEKCDLILFILDAKEGVTIDDTLIYYKLRKYNKKIITVYNKSEGKKIHDISEVFKIGIDEIIKLSAEHSQGIDDLIKAIESNLVNSSEKFNSISEYNNKITIAVVGRPNVGKSTLVNSLINEDRLITGPKSGITRDSIDVSWSINNHIITLTDTAGIRKQSRISDKIESLSVIKTKKTINLAEVVLLLLDANIGIDAQDLRIAKLVIEEGRGLIILINKIDLVRDFDVMVNNINHRLNKSLHQARGINTVYISAENKKGLDKIFYSILEVYNLWNKRVPTNELNKWLEKATEKHPLPSISGKKIKIRYITQLKSRPPTFILFSSKGNKIPKSYLNFLVNEIRNQFDFPGVPIRLYIRKPRNPYV
ncbi:MAG: ribosome biogenesis GTPase Der [Rhodospirillaceae bacterium]|nr:ribosome biogenesis GTPase Der [Rhodospirillaceae bacterium]|tara:strand:- start:15650 stop:16981 length:1332 start_codon:yes stop_codon:yes gene_type:complete